MYRQFFTAEEKRCLQKLIIKYQLHTSAMKAVGNLAAKKAAWARLTQEYNSVKTNKGRTEAQLKKCWDNMKTRKKQQLALQKRERMKEEGGHLSATIEDILEEPQSPTDIETIVLNSDYALQLTEEDSHEIEIEEEQADHEPSVERSEDSVEDTTRAHTIRDEFEIRKRNYQLAQEREEELHRLKIREMKLRVLAAEEIYKKARIERQNAEELLKKQRDRVERSLD